MILNSFRGLAVILLVSILIIKEIPFKKLFKDAMIQFYLAVACMAILLLVDNIIGFILSICVLTLYFRIYTSELKNKNVATNKQDAQVASASASASAHIHDGKGCGDGKCEMNMARLEDKSRTATVAASAASASADGKVPYITEENLLAAQSNIVNPNEYNKELHSDNLYGSQGLDTKHLHIRGYDTTNALLGSLSYEII
jgi:Ca2+/Na+ antiporter